MVDKTYIFQIIGYGWQKVYLSNKVGILINLINVLGWNDTRSNAAANSSFYQPRLRRKSCELSSFSCFFLISQILICSIKAQCAWNHTVAWIVCKNDSELVSCTLFFTLICHTLFILLNWRVRIFVPFFWTVEFAFFVLLI